MSWNKVFYFVCIACLAFVSCQTNSEETGRGESVDPGPAKGNTDARGFEIQEGAEETRLLVFDPWNRQDTFAIYELTKGQEYSRWTVFSTTHIGFLDALGAADKVVGCTTPDRIYNASLRQKFKDGKLVRVGSDMEYNIESLHQLRPDILIQSAFPGQKSKDARILDSGIKVVYLMEWLEPTPLGRAEWIRVFGLLLNQRERADSIFTTIRKSYVHLTTSYAHALKDKPQVLIGNSFKGTWYMPGGNSYQAQFIEDAGFQYPYLTTHERGSLPLSFEAVLHTFKDAPIWINVASDNLDDLIREDERYELFASFANQRVYGYSKRGRDDRSNDYWESGVVHPHLILKDLIAIAYPDVLPDYELYYYQRLQ